MDDDIGVLNTYRDPSPDTCKTFDFLWLYWILTRNNTFALPRDLAYNILGLELPEDKVSGHKTNLFFFIRTLDSTPMEVYVQKDVKLKDNIVESWTLWCRDCPCKRCARRRFILSSGGTYIIPASKLATRSWKDLIDDDMINIKTGHQLTKTLWLNLIKQ
jgi:hypothetical protein